MKRLLVALVAGSTLVGGLLTRGGGAAESVAPSAPPEAVVPTGVGDVEHLQPPLARAVRRAIAAAAAAGVDVRVTSGWRSRTTQQALYAEAIVKYGTPVLARRWVLPPDESNHVKGLAVDVSPVSGARWLETHGVHYGLCRRYDNEPWHFERLAAAKGSVCPPREPHA